MGEIIKFGMIFDSETAPDFGSIEKSQDGNFTLLNADKGKLNSALTRAVCAPLLQNGGLFSVPSGANAIIADVPAVWRYHAQSDTWYKIIDEL